MAKVTFHANNFVVEVTEGKKGKFSLDLSFINPMGELEKHSDSPEGDLTLQEVLDVVLATSTRRKFVDNAITRVKRLVSNLELSELNLKSKGKHIQLVDSNDNAVVSSKKTGKNVEVVVDGTSLVLNKNDYARTRKQILDLWGSSN